MTGPFGSLLFWLDISCPMSATIYCLDLSALESAITLKIKIIFSQLLWDRLPYGMEVIKRHDPRNGSCPLCGVLETGTHIIFTCMMVRFLWSFVCEALGPDKEALDRCTIARFLWSFVCEALGPNKEALDLISFLQTCANQT
jgi:hypothetical protein